MKDPAFILGNGPSRRGVDLEDLKTLGTVWGCNAIYRDFSPHYLVAADATMQKELVDAGYHLFHRVAFRESHYTPDHPNVYSWQPAFKQPVNSGLAAIYFALKMGHKNIYILGFDLKNNKKDFNIYQGTKNYSARMPKYRANTWFPLRAWVSKNPDIKFTRVIPRNGWEGPLSMIRHIDYGEFENECNELRSAQTR